MSVFEKMEGRFAKMKNAFPPLREVLSEDGIGSYSRYTGFIITIATLLWITFLVIKNHAIPDLQGPAVFVGTGQAQYGLNQIKKVFQAARGENPGPTNGTVTKAVAVMSAQAEGTVQGTGEEAGEV